MREAVSEVKKKGLFIKCERVRWQCLRDLRRVKENDWGQHRKLSESREHALVCLICNVNTFFKPALLISFGTNIPLNLSMAGNLPGKFNRKTKR